MNKLRGTIDARTFAYSQENGNGVAREKNKIYIYI